MFFQPGILQKSRAKSRTNLEGIRLIVALSMVEDSGLQRLRFLTRREGDPPSLLFAIERFEVSLSASHEFVGCGDTMISV